MKYLPLIILTAFSATAFSQNAKPPVKSLDSVVKAKYLDSIASIPPHPDSPFISMNQLNVIWKEIRSKWNMETGEPAGKAFQILIGFAGEEYKKKRLEQLKKDK